MGQLVRIYCDAYTALEEAARDRAPRAPVLHVAEIVQILERHPDTVQKFKRIEDELEVLGRNSLDDELIADRLAMPQGFIHALFTAMRLGGNALIRIETVEFERSGAAIC